MRKSLIFTAAFFFLGIFSAAPAYALKISPFKSSLTSGGGDMTQLFRLENTSPHPTAVQVSVLTWEIDPDGKEINESAEDDFAIFPAQIILQPYERKAVRVQWLGDVDLSEEKAFRVLAEQVPVNVKSDNDEGAGLRFLLRYKAALYITPPDAQSHVVVEQAQPVTGSDKLRLSLYNKGAKHTILNNPTLMLELRDGRELKLTSGNLETLAGENMHGLTRRFFDITLPGISADQVRTATLNYESGL